ncbi:tRNA 2-thiocytidine biosynthesis protein TtcA [bacterium HR19]|nr:tRNA 2-thiocytidine biosynthesis protein TtcA [bacterium HR19]
MLCRKCKEKAVINLRQYNLPLCKEHFIERYISVVEDTIRRFKMFSRNDKVLVAVSGGKDSLALWYVLKKLGYKVTGLYINLGIENEKGEEGYSNMSERCCKNLAEKIDSELIVENVYQKYGSPAPLLDRNRAPCSVCGITKRHIMNEVAKKYGFDVVATGHNLDDEVATLLSNVLRWDEEYLKRQYPVLPAEDGFSKKVKPLVFLTEKENLAFCIFEGIEFYHEECPFSKDATSIFMKNIWAQIEEKMPGSKIRFFREFLEFRKKFLSQEERKDLGKCSICGQPTTAGDMCAFHRIISKIKVQHN